MRQRQSLLIACLQPGFCRVQAAHGLVAARPGGRAPARPAAMECVQPQESRQAARCTHIQLSAHSSMKTEVREHCSAGVVKQGSKYHAHTGNPYIKMRLIAALLSLCRTLVPHSHTIGSNSTGAKQGHASHRADSVAYVMCALL